MKILLVILGALVGLVAGHLFGDALFGTLNRSTGLSAPVSTSEDSAPPPTESPAPVPDPIENSTPDLGPPPELEVVPVPVLPIATLADSRGGSIGTGAFRAQAGVSAHPATASDITCSVTGFELIYIAKRADPVASNNAGARFTDRSLQLVRRAKPGDVYLFDNIRARCGADQSSSDAGTMVFRIR